jgi:N-acetylmuramoyl-L-alanine amidase
MLQKKEERLWTDNICQAEKHSQGVNKFQGENRRLNCFWQAAAIMVAFLLSINLAEATEVSNVRHWAAPDHTRIVFDLDHDPAYKFQQIDNTLTIELADASLSQSMPTEIIVHKPGIDKIVLSTLESNTVKIEFILSEHSKVEVFKLKKFQNKPERLVVDIILKQAAREEPAKEQIPQVPQLKRKKVIVIDPGHGGEDPGAVGKKGTYEKHVVLAISREIKKAINKTQGYRAILTRDGDYYVSFNRRLQIAKDADASLFVSVHADAARNRNARGSSVYCLSTGAASNEAAKLLANNENLSDIIGGVPNGEGNNQSDQIILNMFQTNTINLSKTYANNLINHLGQVNSLKHRSLQEAPFRVLKLLDIPAVLLETAYISNDNEERLLKNGAFQKKLAVAIASSVVTYLSGTASISFANTQDVPLFPEDDKSKSGERKKSVKVYTVRKGDTLFSLAKNNSITVEELRKLNNMQNSANLLYGQKIKLPQ